MEAVQYTAVLNSHVGTEPTLYGVCIAVLRYIEVLKMKAFDLISNLRGSTLNITKLITSTETR